MYVGLGWRVFPVWGVVPGAEDGAPRICACVLGHRCDRPGKHPIAELAPSGLSDATDSRAKVEAWWGARPEASIGIATGAMSGLTVVDADVGGGKPGLINLTRLCAAHGGVPATMAVETGGGGLHLYFKYNAALRNGVDVLDEAIDVRSDGGYVIAPPSNHVMRVYKWREDRAELKDLPEWMINAPAEAAGRGAARRRGRPRTRAALPLEQVEEMLKCVDPDDRDRWLKVGVILGKSYVGTPAEAEAWAAYEAWAARSAKFDEHRSENLDRMREQFAEVSQQAPRAGQEPIGIGSLVLWAKEGGWSPFGDREVVTYRAGDEAKMCREMIAALVADGAGNRFFNIMGEVRDVLITALPSLRSIYAAQNAGAELPETLVVRRASLSGLASALSERCVVVLHTETGPKAKPIPEALVNMMLKDHSSAFPPLAGICEWPMVMNEQVISKPRGYDADTGMYFEIPESIKIENVTVEDAWKWLCEEFFVDFPFEGDIHRARALGMMLCMMQRPLMKTAPGFAVTAPQPGTGKSTLVEAAAIAIHGANVFSHAFSSDEEELRKALHALMIAKVPTVMFDNVGRGRAVHSDHLAKMITSEASTDRVLGSSETRTEVNSMLLTFTGNNIVFTRDMASRVITIRLNAHVANPIGRTFRHGDLKTWARNHRSKILSCLVAIAKQNSTQDMTGARASRFEDFDSLIVGAVHRATGIDIRIVDEETDSGVDDEENADTREMLRVLWAWQQTLRNDRCGKPWRVSELLAAYEARAFSESQMSALQRWVGGERDWERNPARALGYAFRAVRDGHNYAPFVVGGRATKDGQLWRITNSESQESDSAPAREAF